MNKTNKKSFFHGTEREKDWWGPIRSVPHIYIWKNSDIATIFHQLNYNVQKKNEEKPYNQRQPNIKEEKKIRWSGVFRLREAHISHIELPVITFLFIFVNESIIRRSIRTIRCATFQSQYRTYTDKNILWLCYTYLYIDTYTRAVRYYNIVYIPAKVTQQTEEKYKIILSEEKKKANEKELQKKEKKEERKTIISFDCVECCVSLPHCCWASTSAAVV